MDAFAELLDWRRELGNVGSFVAWLCMHGSRWAAFADDDDGVLAWRDTLVEAKW
jgi:hypothetical protein